MGLTSHVDFDLRPHDKEEADFLVSALMGGIHLAIVQECGNGEAGCRQDRLAVAFPHATTGKGAHGSVLRVFGAADVLGRMLRHPALHRYATSLATPIAPVPAAEAFVALRRDQTGKKASPSYLARQARRGRPLPVSRPASEGPARFSFEVMSRSTARTFLLAVTPTPAPDAGSGLFTAYGLSAGGATPVFGNGM